MPMFLKQRYSSSKNPVKGYCMHIYVKIYIYIYVQVQHFSNCITVSHEMRNNHINSHLLSSILLIYLIKNNLEGKKYIVKENRNF